MKFTTKDLKKKQYELPLQQVTILTVFVLDITQSHVLYWKKNTQLSLFSKLTTAKLGICVKKFTSMHDTHVKLANTQKKSKQILNHNLLSPITSITKSDKRFS